MDGLIRHLCRLLEGLIAFALAGMVMLVFGNVILRYGFNSGIAISEELSRWLFIWLTFLGTVVCLRDNAHLGTDILVSRLSPRGKRACLLAAHAIMLWVLWLLFTGSWAQAELNLQVRAPVTGLSVAIFYASGIVVAVLSAIVLLSNMWKVVTGQLTDEQLVMVSESEEQAELDALTSRLATLRTGPSTVSPDRKEQ